MNVDIGVTIDAPPGAVWAIVEPIDRHVDWMADAERITFTSERTRGVGTSFVCLTKIGPFRLADRMTVTEWDPQRAMGIEHRGLVTGRGRFTLRPAPGGRTRFTWMENLRVPWWMGGFVAAPVLRAVWRRNLRRLKALVESGDGNGEA
jgi:hypothetical protein